jgi:hypothetical protein
MPRTATAGSAASAAQHGAASSTGLDELIRRGRAQGHLSLAELRATFQEAGISAAEGRSLIRELAEAGVRLADESGAPVDLGDGPDGSVSDASAEPAADDVSDAEAEAAARAAGDDEAFVIGGAEVYRQALPFTDRIYMTLVLAEVEGDAKFPEVDWDVWARTESESVEADADNEYPTLFYTFDRCEIESSTH